MPEITISDAALAFLKSRAVPLEDTTTTVMDKLIADFRKLADASGGKNGKGLHFDLHSVPSVKFTSINSASIAGQPASQNYWNNILEDVIAACAGKGIKRKEIIDSMSAKCQLGKHIEGGFRYVEAADLSFQGLEANRAYKNIVLLAEKFEISIDIALYWQDNQDAALPNMSATIVYP